MNTLAVTTSGRKINFQASDELYNRALQVAIDYNSSLSEIIRRSLEEKIERLEEEKIRKELEAGYKANYELDKQMNEEWKYVDVE